MSKSRIKCIMCLTKKGGSAMKRFMAVAVLVSVLFFASNTTVFASTELQEYLKEHSSMKVCVELINSSGDAKVDVPLLKKMIEEAFATRKAYSFTVVQTALEADIVFKGDIKEYIWMKDDPVDEVYGIGAAAMDAAIIENYARIQIQSEIIDVKKNSVLWTDKVKATMTKKDMPIGESYTLIYPKLIKSEMIEIFRKARQSVM